MKPISPSLTRHVITHGICGVVAAGLAWKFSAEKTTTAENPTTDLIAANSSNREGNLLEHLTTELKEKTPTVDKFSLDAFNKRFTATATEKEPGQKFLALYAELSSLEDDALLTDAQKKALVSKRELAMVYLKQWINQNPDEAMKWLASEADSESLQRMSGVDQQDAFDRMDAIFDDQLKRQGFRAFTDLCLKNGLQEPLLAVLLRDLSERGSTADFAYLTEKFGDINDAMVGSVMGRHWNVEQREELLGILSPNQQAEAIAQLAQRMDGENAVAWVREQISSGKWNANLVEKLKPTSLGSHYYAMENLTLDQRVEIMDLLGRLGNTTEKRVKDELIFQSMSKQFVMGDDDVLYQFRNGNISASEAYQHMLENSLDPGDHINEFQSQAFRTLAQENLTEAVKMLAGKSPEDIEWQKIHAARWWFRNSSPDDFFALTASVQTNNDRQMERMLYESWQEKSGMYLSQYGSSYFEWLKTMPDGIGRDRALDAFIRNAKGQFDAQVTEAQNLRK